MKITGVEPFQIETQDPSPPSRGRVEELIQEIATSVQGAAASDADSDSFHSVADFIQFRARHKKKKAAAGHSGISAYLKLDQMERALAELGQFLNKRA